MGWLSDFSAAAIGTDRLIGKPEHRSLLAKGLFGEAGSVLAEFKKEIRDPDTYPAVQKQRNEEVGDFLWYLVRFADTITPGLLNEFDRFDSPLASENANLDIQALSLGSAVGAALDSEMRGSNSDTRSALRRAWVALRLLCAISNISLEKAAKENLEKNRSRWPEDNERKAIGLFDTILKPYEQLPRKLEVEFLEPVGRKTEVILVANGLNFGNRVTDNAAGDPDGYRYHDAFHLAYAVFLGWSPVVRSLLRVKRKSDPKIDEGEDGARAMAIEEAVSAAVFSRAKRLRNFDGITSLDYGLLKTVHQLVEDLEVWKAPLWQWEEAILQGYVAFRSLLKNNGGFLTLDLLNRTLEYRPRSTPNP